MRTQDQDAAHAAFAVGYESPTQFNREYKRLFGEPPLRDVSRCVKISAGPATLERALHLS